MFDNPFGEEIFPNIQSKLLSMQKKKVMDTCQVCGSGWHSRGILLPFSSMLKSGPEAVQIPSNSLPHGASNMHTQTTQLARREKTRRNPPNIQPGPRSQLTQEPFSSFPALRHLPEPTVAAGGLQSAVLSAPPCTRACPASLRKRGVRAGKRGPAVRSGGKEAADCWGGVSGV